MPWTDVLASWPDLIDPLCLDFPHLDPAAVARFRGNRARMETYLGETHDLTAAEAAETLDQWLTYKGAFIARRAAA